MQSLAPPFEFTVSRKKAFHCLPSACGSVLLTQLLDIIHTKNAVQSAGDSGTRHLLQSFQPGRICRPPSPWPQCAKVPPVCSEVSNFILKRWISKLPPGGLNGCPLLLHFGGLIGSHWPHLLRREEEGVLPLPGPGLVEAAGMRESSLHSTSAEGLLVTWHNVKPLECWEQETSI